MTMQKHGLFSSRETLDEAVRYADALINTLPIAHRMTAFTAMWVPLNTALQDIAKKDLANVLPLMPGNHHIVIENLSPEDAAPIIRSLVAEFMDKARIIRKFLPSIGETFFVFGLLICRLYNISYEDLDREINDSPIRVGVKMGEEGEGDPS